MNREKKQMVVLGVLALMIVCIGGFQMMGGETAPVPTPAPKKEEKKVDETFTTSVAKSEVANPEQSRPLAKRDPFAPSAFAISANEDPNAPAPVKPTANRPGGRRPIPDVLQGGSKDIEWVPGGVNEGGVEPFAPDAPKFAYTLIGLVQGKYPAAVFADATGNQKLVEAGDAIDSSTTLIAVYGNKVKVKFHDQTLVLSVGGNPNGK